MGDNLVLPGVIKGSEETLSSGRRFLSREQYLKLPLRSYQTFAKNRDDLYTVFERYQKRKRHLDIADRCVIVYSHRQY